MGMFGAKSAAAVAKFDPSQLSKRERFGLLASAISDAGASLAGRDSDKLLNAQSMLAARQQQAAKLAFAEKVRGLIGGQYQDAPPPVVQRPEMAAPKVMGDVGDVSLGLPDAAPISEPYTYQPPTKTPPAGIADPRWGEAALSGKMLGVDLGDTMEWLKANQPNVQIGPGGEPFNTKDPSVIGHRFRDPTTINGWLIDQNKPANEGQFFPELPRGVIPNGQGGVNNITGLAAAMGEQEEAQTTGRTRGSMFTAPNPDGSGTMLLGRDYLGGAGGARSAVSGPGGLGTSQSTAEKAYTENEARGFGDLVATAPTLKQGGQTNTQLAQQGLAYVLGLKPNVALGVLGEAARFIPGANAQTFAGDVRSFKSLTNQALVENAKMLGANPSNRDVKILESVFPQITSPQAMAATFFATKAAAANKQQAYGDFLATYDGPKTRQAVQRAWLATPASRRSVFQDPVWQGIHYGGQPSVVYKEKGGKRYGVFRPFNADGSINPGAQVFEAY